MRRVNANRLNGIDAEWLTPDDIARICPILDLSPDARYPILGATFQPRGGIAKHDHVAWGYARGADALGRRPDRGRRGHRHRHRGRPGDRRADVARADRRRPGRDRRGRARLDPGRDGRHPAAAPEPSAPGARLGAARADRADGRHVERGPRLHQPGVQGRAGDRRRASTPGTATASAARSTSSSASWPRWSSCSRSSRARTCCGRGPGSSTSRPTRRRSSADSPVGGPVPQLRLGDRRVQGDAGVRAGPGPHDRARRAARAGRPFALERFTTGALIDEHGAAVAAH